MDRITGLLALAGALALGAGCGGGSSGPTSDFAGASGANACLVPESEIISGGPGRDGIPALTNPVVVSADEGDQIFIPGALVLGVVEGGEARAYPHSILWWHEIVNDVLGGVPIAVSYCPLTGSGMVYDSRIGGQELNFGVSGLLFDNNLIMFDRTTESLWSQMGVQAVCGSLVSTVPALRPVVQTTWGAWRALYPLTTVVSTNTGFSRSYGVYPYGNYDQIGDESFVFPQSDLDRRRPLKELALGISEGAAEKAYPYGLMGERSAFNEVVGSRPIVVVYDRGAALALAFDRRSGGQTLTFEIADQGAFPFLLRDAETGSEWTLGGAAVSGPLTGSTVEQIATYSAMWFAWAAFHPDTELFAP